MTESHRGRPVDRWPRLFECYMKGDTDGALELCDPAVEWETGWPGLDGVYRGHEGLRRWTELVKEPMEWAQTELVESEELDDERVLLTTRLKGRGKGSGADVSMVVFDIWTFGAGGLVRRQVFYESDRARAAARG